MAPTAMINTLYHSNKKRK